MTIEEAIKTLDGVIPSPQNKMVDLEHLPIAQAWETVKKELQRYQELGTVEELDEASYNASL